MDPHAQQFLISEFEALRREIDGNLAASRDLVSYALFTSALIWTWLITKKPNEPLPHGVEFIAPLLSVLLGLRALTLTWQIGRIGEYILLVESKLALPPGLGWETHFHSLGQYARLDLAVDALWAMIIIANTSAAIFYRKKRPKKNLIQKV
jgi:hypothetical protein